MFTMKQYFLGKTFSSELEYWNYLVSIRDNKFDCADGLYLGYFLGKEQGFFLTDFEYYNTHDLDGVPLHMMKPMHFMIFVRDGHMYNISFNAFPLSICAEKQNNEWVNISYEDDPHRYDYIFEKCSEEEMRGFFNELNELLIIESKKVG